MVNKKAQETILNAMPLTEHIFSNCSSSERKIFMAGTIDNRRSQFTKQIIQQTFFDLLKEKDLNKITVKEIAEKADINRGTFYRYYTDVLDLYNKIQTSYIQTVKQEFTEIELNLEKSLTTLLNFVKKDEGLQILVLKSSQSDKFTEQVLLSVKNLSLQNFALSFPQASPFELELSFAFFTSGAISLIKYWLEEDIDYPIEKIVQLLIQLTQTTHFTNNS